MAGSVNKVILVGNLGKDPEVRRLNSGDRVVNSRSPPPRPGATRPSGERKEKTEWHNVVIFNENLAKVAEQYLQEGHQGLRRGPAADPQMDGPERRRALLDRSGAAAIPRRTAMLDSRGGGEGRESFPEEGAPQPELQPRPGGRAPTGALQRRRPDRRRHSVLRGGPAPLWGRERIRQPKDALTRRVTRQQSFAPPAFGSCPCGLQTPPRNRGRSPPPLWGRLVGGRAGLNPQTHRYAAAIPSALRKSSPAHRQDCETRLRL